MQKERNVLNFYLQCNKLKDVIRGGWKDWNVERHRVESVAEHIFGVQMLAIAMWSEFGYDVDILKVVTMLAVHEIEETVIGDFTCFDISPEEKAKRGHTAVEKIFAGLMGAKQLENMIYEFDARKTKEAKFAYWCDKLECDLQAKLYDEQHCVDLAKQENCKAANDEVVNRLLAQGMGFGEMWLTVSQCKYDYDKNFVDVSNFAKSNKLLKD